MSDLNVDWITTLAADDPNPNLTGALVTLTISGFVLPTAQGKAKS